MLIRKIKQEILFLGLAVGVFAVLQYTPPGQSLIAEVRGWFLSIPNFEDLEEEFVSANDLNWGLESVFTGERKTIQDFLDKPLILHFWATWCGACIAEMPSLVQLSQKLGHRVNVAMVSFEELPRLKENSHCFSNKTHHFVANSRIPEAFKVSAYPTTYIMDRHGFIRSTIEGPRNWNSPEVENFILGLED